LLDELVRRLLAARNAQGHWEGFLASSALSTATASSALALAGGNADLVDRGLAWLARTQNPDGGWGDTVRSQSNISTTSLCAAAFAIAGRTPPESARAWLERAAGGAGPDRLRAAILRRYESDQTFSVPILTVLAIAGQQPWSAVPQLPFELARFPRSWFSALNLRVVSYALPALIAIGQVHHRMAPTWNPALRWVRDRASEPTLDLLRAIQPESGGYLEATPLTSFVVMSLVRAGLGDHAVARAGTDFLRASAREDGSWPIDTNLATWVTTLSVNALAPLQVLPAGDRERIADWLLRQQYRTEHAYTGAAPGGWAWSDLSGAVPDADDTPGALLALRHLGVRHPECREAAEAGVAWLLDLQNRDGGIPTFCRGWGKLPFDRSSPDLTAHTLLAWDAWRSEIGAQLQSRIGEARRRAIGFLTRTQRPDGAWIPLWFGNEGEPRQDNPVYGTGRVLAAVQRESGIAGRGARFLLESQNPDGGWGGAAGLTSSIEETSIAMYGLAGMAGAESAIQRGVEWLRNATGNGVRIPASPIGLYFAKLWYYEDLYPLIFAVSALAKTIKLP